MKNKTISLTSPDWILDILDGLARSNLMKRNSLINSILFQYMRENNRLFSEDSRKVIEEAMVVKRT